MTSEGTPTKIFEFMTLIGRLKATKRTGWVQRGVSDPESVADHMYRMAIMAFLVDPKSGLNKERCIKLALVHDMAESIVGDLTPSDGISKEEKHVREKAAMEHIQSLVSIETGEELYTLWEEYELETTEEARFVKDIDKFDMVLQAYEYEQLDKKPGFLQDFFTSTKGKFKTDQVKEWVQDLNSVRNHQETRQTVIQHKTPGAPDQKAEQSSAAESKTNNPTSNGAAVESDSDSVSKRRKVRADPEEVGDVSLS